MQYRYLLPALLLLAAGQAALADGGKPNFNKNVEFAEEGPWQEGEYQLPTYPQPQADWIRVEPELRQNNNQIFVDGSSLSVAPDGVVRFVLKQVSPAGVNNLSFEGIQCKNKNFRAYAFGDESGKRWISSSRALWQPIAQGDKLHRQLRSLVCPDGLAPTDAAQALQSLRRG